MIDSGAQSSINSWEMLHRIARCLNDVGKPMPKLKLPSARLYGKDGAGGYRKQVVTAEENLLIEVDGESACVTVFVKPGSSQHWLLGMNALPFLGFKLLRPNGHPLITRCETNPKISLVRLVQGTTIPSLKGSFVKVKAYDLPLLPGTSILFEPNGDRLELSGLHSHESVVTMLDDGCQW